MEPILCICICVAIGTMLDLTQTHKLRVNRALHLAFSTFRRKMAELDDSVCNVCLGPFDCDTVIPRLLPCSHTACHSCLEKLVRKLRKGWTRYLVCPECRKKHTVRTGVKAFPQNRYIINRLKPKADPGTRRFEECKKHRRDISLHCQNCASDICQIYMLTEHQTHAVVDLIEREKGRLDARIDKVQSDIRLSVRSYEGSKKDVDKKFTENMASLAKMRQDVAKKINDYSKELVEQKINFRRQIDGRLEKLRRYSAQLSSINLLPL